MDFILGSVTRQASRFIAGRPASSSGHPRKTRDYPLHDTPNHPPPVLFLLSFFVSFVTWDFKSSLWGGLCNRGRTQKIGSELPQIEIAAQTVDETFREGMTALCSAQTIFTGFRCRLSFLRDMDSGSGEGFYSQFSMCGIQTFALVTMFFPCAVDLELYIKSTTC